MSAVWVCPPTMVCAQCANFMAFGSRPGTESEVNVWCANRNCPTVGKKLIYPMQRIELAEEGPAAPALTAVPQT